MGHSSEVQAIAEQVAQAHQLAVDLAPHDSIDPRHQRLLDLLYSAEQGMERLVNRLLRSDW